MSADDRVKFPLTGPVAVQWPGGNKAGISDCSIGSSVIRGGLRVSAVSAMMLRI